MPALLVCIVQMLLTRNLTASKNGCFPECQYCRKCDYRGRRPCRNLAEGQCRIYADGAACAFDGNAVSFAIGTLYSVFVGNVIYVSDPAGILWKAGVTGQMGNRRAFYGFKTELFEYSFYYVYDEPVYFSLVSASGSAN